MFVIGNLLGAVASILHWLLWIYVWLLIAHAVLSWIPHDPLHPIPRFLSRVSGWILNPIRRLVPMQGLGLDLSPLLGILLLWFTDMFVIASLLELAERL